ncbi:SWIM zinc finger family protein [Plebeiibacterium sediminum]|uniref:SWIM zinc finger family protein n=1 Tax=Plebeiibacterium sediminum TaxID=2992112 RepID=A0AAE3M9D6_9BACT|nr:SWIM zinc finger family protein [Plebeiobacterium sediminum]MCW3789396.1 SWIM zinc finger family protein [Plebeiobacterium sediminum]
MQRFGDYLFDASSMDLKESLDNIFEDDIESCCDYKIFNRGYEYFESGLVEYASIEKANNLIQASVNGSYEYEVEIYQHEDKIYGTCSCPYGGAVCKHIIAVLLHVVDEGIDNIPVQKVIKVTAKEEDVTLDAHLKQLSKSELIKLVKKYIPDDFVLQLQNKKTDKKDALVIFQRVEKKINGFFNDHELLYEPSVMEDALLKQLKKLSGFENIIAEEIGKLFVSIMEKVDSAFDEGYLYIDDYYGDGYFESSDFNQLVIDYTSHLPIEQKIKYLEKLDDTLLQMSYTTFEEIAVLMPSSINPPESSQLCDYLLTNEQMLSDSLLSRLYNNIEKKLADDQKERLLLKLSGINQNHFISLIKLLMGQSRYSEAYEHIEQYLDGSNGYVNEEMLDYYLDLCIKTNGNINNVARKVIDLKPDKAILLKVKNYNLQDISHFEQVLKKRNAYDLLSYYEDENRLQDALDLIKNNLFYDDMVFQFYKKYKKQFKEEAQAYFLKRLEENLENAGNSNYARIAETISQLRQINQSMANKLLTDIRINYKRRRNLIQMLSRF